MAKQSKIITLSEVMKHWNRLTFPEALNELLDYYGYERYYKTSIVHHVEFILKKGN